jgi:hypothetical protein
LSLRLSSPITGKDQERLAGVAGAEVRFSKGQTEADAVFPETASVRWKDARFGLSDGLAVVAEVAMEFAGGILLGVARCVHRREQRLDVL